MGLIGCYVKILLTADPELHVPPTLYGGIERVVALLADEVSRRGHSVGVVCRQGSTVKAEALFPWPGDNSHGKIATLQNMLALRSAVKNFRPDIVHSFSRLAYLLGIFGSSVPRIMSYQREPSGKTVSYSRRIHGSRLQFTACSGQLAEKGRKRGGGNWMAIPNFIDPSKFDFTSTVADDAPLVFLSRIEPIKGCHNAIAIAKASGRRLLIAGNRVEKGGSVGYWQCEIEPHLGKDGIEYVGPVDDTQKNNLLGQAAAMVLPIEWDEPFGIVFAEALACGTPVIATPRGAVPEIVEHGVHGFHVAGVEEGVAAVANLRTISRAACRQQVEERFSLPIVASQYLKLYESMLKPLRNSTDAE